MKLPSAFVFRTARASVAGKPALAQKVRPEIEALAKDGARNVQVEARNLLKKLPEKS